MPADVVEPPDVAVLVAHDDHRGPCALEFLGEVAACAGDLLHPADVQPGPAEDGLAFELVELGRDGILVVHRARPQIGVVLGPTSLLWLWEVRHMVSSSCRAGRLTISAIFLEEKGSSQTRSSSSGTSKERNAMANSVVGPDRENQVHQLLDIQPAGEDPPGFVGHLGVVEQFVDRADHGSIEGRPAAGVAAPLRSGPPRRGDAGVSGQHQVLSPLIGRLSHRRNPKDQDLSLASRKCRTRRECDR